MQGSRFAAAEEGFSSAFGIWTAALCSAFRGPEAVSLAAEGTKAFSGP